MTTARLTRFQVSIDVESDVPALLDMLRYEGGRVVSWDHTGSRERRPGQRPAPLTFLVTIEVEALRYVPDRWHSFGISPKEV